MMLVASGNQNVDTKTISYKSYRYVIYGSFMIGDLELTGAGGFAFGSGKHGGLYPNQKTSVYSFMRKSPYSSTASDGYIYLGIGTWNVQSPGLVCNP